MPERYNDIDDDLLVKHILAETDEAENAAVLAWLADSDVNRNHYGHLKWIWEESRRLALKSSMDENAAWERFRNKLQTQKPSAKKSSMFWLRIAAALVIVAGLAIFASRLSPRRMVKQELFAVVDNPASDTLSDGSIITLNKRSMLSYPEKFTGSSRPVTLKGEAFFRIAPDKQKPFIIVVNSVQVTVVGTAFNIKSDSLTTEITVESGIVEVKTEAGNIRLEAGERVTVGNGNASMEKSVVTDELYKYYETKQFVCDNTPLWRLVDVLNEAYHANISIGRRELRELPLTTTFNDASLDTILEVVAATFKLSVERNGNNIILK